jgi:hypothetical protein
MDGEDISPKYFRRGEVTAHVVCNQKLIGKKIHGEVTWIRAQISLIGLLGAGT